jgi:integrase
MHKHYPASVANMVEFRFFAGVRTSEMAGLRWPSVDFGGKPHVVVHEAFVLGEYKDTKTSRSRVVDLNSRALAALKAQKEQTYLAGGVVFPDPETGAPWTGDAFRNGYWIPTLKRLGIRHRPPNHARHTYATMLLMAGARPPYAAAQMGHSVQVFLTTYAKWIDGGENEIEQNKLERFIKAPREAQKAGNE